MRWQKWRLRVGFNAREGLVLHAIGYEDGGRLRPVLHRAALSRDGRALRPSRRRALPQERLRRRRVRHRRAGQLADAGLRLPRRDPLLRRLAQPTARASPTASRSAVCLHEEDFGILWKHTDLFTGEVDVRRARRLVVSSISTVGNYEYGLVLVLPPGRLDPLRDQGDRDREHRRASSRASSRTTARSCRPESMRTTISTSSTCASTWRSTASATGSSRSTRWRCRSGPTIRTATPSRSARAFWPPSWPRSATSISTPRASGRSRAPTRATALGQPTAYKLLPLEPGADLRQPAIDAWPGAPPS